MKKSVAAIAAIALVATVLSVSSRPDPARATVPTPVEYEDIRIDNVTAHTNGNLTMLSCNHLDAPNAYYTKGDGTIISSTPSWNDGAGTCSSSNMDEVSLDGMMFTFRNKTTSPQASTLMAWKNDRLVWTQDITSPVNCTGTSYVSYLTRAASMSIGPDGNLYFIATAQPEGSGYKACPDRLMGLAMSTGNVLLDITLAVGLYYGAGFTAQAWTYDDKIIVLDLEGTVRAFEYDGDEIISTAYPYTFPQPRVSSYLYVIAALPLADEYGTVFVQSSNNVHPANVMYHKDDGTTGSIDRPNQYTTWPMELAPGGNVMTYRDNFSYDVFDISTNTYTNVVVGNPHSSSYPNGGITAVVYDENDNTIVIRQLHNSSYTSSMVSVDLIEPGTPATITNLFELSASDGVTTPLVFNRFASRSIANGYLYLSICQEVGFSTCSAVDPPSASWVYKIDVGNFGDPIHHRNGYSGYVDTRLRYVAMGDSFSSGEGYPPFLNTNNACDRSSGAYAHLLTSLYGLDLNLVDHVACSGATMAEVLGGKYNEPPQTNALNATTDVVTISIGGNDALFAAYAMNCVDSFDGGCGPGSIAYAAVMGVLANPNYSTDLENIYETILTDTPNAEVFVVGYPYVTPTDPSDPFCFAFQDYTDNSPVDDANAARLVVDALNDTSNGIVDAIDDSRLHFVDPTSSGNPFEGHDVCSSVPYFTYPFATAPGDWKSWFHPNQAGQIAYADVIADAMD